ncbi:MAG: hypothetical protein R3E95_18785 [Thiolinea sp.]
MKHAQDAIASIVLYVIALIGLLPLALLGVRLFRQPEALHAALETLAGQTAIPVIFAILFALGCGLCVYLARKILLVLLLPLLLIALMPLWQALSSPPPDPAPPPFHYGQTQPGEGFKIYAKDTWNIRITYPPDLQQQLKTSGKQPIVLASLGGNGKHRLINNLSIFPYTREDNTTDWWHGVELYFKNVDHRHALERGGITTPSRHEAPPEWPVANQWFISYVVIIPGDY